MLEHSSKSEAEAQRVVRILTAALPIKQAAALAAEITGLEKNVLYDYALRLKESQSGKLPAPDDV